VLNSLSGRFLILTTVFVMLAEVLIFVPSIARFREDYLLARLERAQIASLALLAATDTMIDPALEKELLENAGVLTVVLRRDEVRELVLAAPVGGMVTRRYDLRTGDHLGTPGERLDTYPARIGGDGVIEVQVSAASPTMSLREALLAHAREGRNPDA